MANQASSRGFQVAQFNGFILICQTDPVHQYMSFCLS